MISMADRFKQIIRQTCQQTRKKLPLAFQRNASQKICNQISQLEQYRYAKRVALYKAVNGEIDLGSIWRSAPLQGKYCYFPALNEDCTLAFLPATPSSAFRTNRFGIEEPDIEQEQAVLPADLSVMFIPLVAFDPRGTRLGMGAGYYDKTLALSRPPLLVGVAYEFQHQSFIEPEAWDIPLDMIITDKTVYWSK
jgi:5-formyltetrahydrofolate cyclo-ligase